MALFFTSNYKFKVNGKNDNQILRIDCTVETFKCLKLRNSVSLSFYAIYMHV